MKTEANLPAIPPLPKFFLNHLPMITGIGSLPHHNIDSALSYSFQYSLPFLPQIPIRHASEYMIAQALTGIPGLKIQPDGSVELDLEVWSSLSDLFEKSLDDCLKTNHYEKFEPKPNEQSAWNAFLWEIQEQNFEFAKIQIAGPMTSQWSLKFQGPEDRPLSQKDVPSQFFSQVVKLLLVRSLAMVKKIQSFGIKPILFIDEPGLFALSTQNPHHQLALTELNILIQTLQKENVIVGLHCCSNTDWKQILKLPIQFLSVDTELTLRVLLDSTPEEFKSFIQRGGRLSFGIIPTGHSMLVQSQVDSSQMKFKLVENLKTIDLPPEERQRILKEALYTPACGLAFHSPADAEMILSKLQFFTQETDI